jgi:hypothetical protein
MLSREVVKMQLDAREAKEEALISKMSSLSAQMHAVAVVRECAICCDDTVSSLDGTMCPSLEHFICNTCMDGWVVSESTPADGAVPKDAGNVWCPVKPGPGGGGCRSDRPFSIKVSSTLKAVVPIKSSSSPEGTATDIYC